MSHILTNEGQYFEFEKPHEHKYKLKEIAHALSHICRYTGHCKWFYPVSQHAVVVSYMVPPWDALEALHHDDSEAYLGDVSSPLKQHLPAYKEMEHAVEAAIAEQLGLRFPYPSSVKVSDMRVLMTEKIYVMCKPAVDAPDVKWPPFEPYPNLKIRRMPIWMARLAYLDRHAEITKEGTWFQKFRIRVGLTPLILLRPSSK